VAYESLHATLWLGRFETALRNLPGPQRERSVLPLLEAYRAPALPLDGGIAPSEAFQSAVRAAKVVSHGDIPHITRGLIDKYVEDLKRLFFEWSRYHSV